MSESGARTALEWRHLSGVKTQLAHAYDAAGSLCGQGPGKRFTIPSTRASRARKYPLTKCPACLRQAVSATTSTKESARG